MPSCGEATSRALVFPFLFTAQGIPQGVLFSKKAFGYMRFTYKRNLPFFFFGSPQRA